MSFVGITSTTFLKTTHAAPRDVHKDLELLQPCPGPANIALHSARFARPGGRVHGSHPTWVFGYR